MSTLLTSPNIPYLMLLLSSINLHNSLQHFLVKASAMAAAAYIRPKRASALLMPPRGPAFAATKWRWAGTTAAAASTRRSPASSTHSSRVRRAGVTPSTALLRHPWRRRPRSRIPTAGGVRRGGRRSGREDGRGGEGASGCRRQGRFLPDSADGRRVGGGGSTGGIPEKPVGVLPRRDGPAARVRLQCRALQGAVGRVEGNRRRQLRVHRRRRRSYGRRRRRGSRYIIDVGFAAEFALARATEEYARVAAALPAVAVARPEEVRRAVKAVAKAARRSLQSRGLSVPPWRKRRFMAAKWLGPYRRTTNPCRPLREPLRSRSRPLAAATLFAARSGLRLRCRSPRGPAIIIIR
uniref:Uncharacterized protein n=1 Tax=Ananas comosus var. bracteatus TaxID=296719 RepID=A0A6V7NPQ3_ANACO|nr:unnamed protein product [Ananas comosus var. bracteatus]